MSFWDKVLDIFRKKKEEETKEEDNLVYTGDEPNCWACQMPIHETHKKMKLRKNVLHKKCFRQLKKIALNGSSINNFEGVGE